MSLILEDQSGNAAQTIPASAAKQVDNYIVFEVDPVMLPNPSRIRLSRPEGNEFLGDLFDPVALTRALHGRHIDLADGILPLAQTKALIQKCWTIERQDDAGSLAPAAAL